MASRRWGHIVSQPQRFRAVSNRGAGKEGGGRAGEGLVLRPRSWRGRGQARNQGLVSSCLSPPLRLHLSDINQPRDPRNGRVGELPTEDPYLMGAYAVEYLQGMQEADPTTGLLKMTAGVKHYAGTWLCGLCCWLYSVARLFRSAAYAAARSCSSSPHCATHQDIAWRPTALVPRATLVCTTCGTPTYPHMRPHSLGEARRGRCAATCL